MKTIKHIIFVIAIALAIQACSPSGGNNTGTEYMPDMAHPISYEANAYDAYDYHTWDEQSVFTRKYLTNKMLPVKGTVPRGYAGVHFTGNAVSDHPNAMSVPMNGKVPYYYADTPEDRLRATAEITANPFPITTSGLERGKELYNIFCGICHGEKGDGLGYLVREANPATGDAGGKYPAAPANLINDEFTAASNGRYYHAIMYGLNVMGAYKDKMSYEERWQVIHYIRSLQAGSKQLKYDESANTLNPQFGTPAAQLKQVSMSNAVTDDAMAPAQAQ
jgi:mono/diheme cytochrome c family protein